MSETKEQDGKSQRSRKTMTLNLKRTVESGHVRQNFSHGRSKSVLVEKKKKRALNAPGNDKDAPTAPEDSKPAVEVKKQAPTKKAEAVVTEKKDDKAKRSKSDKSSRSGVILKSLSNEEHDARLKALKQARVRQAEEAELAEIQEKERSRIEKETQAKRKKEAEEKAAELEKLEKDQAASAPTTREQINKAEDEKREKKEKPKAKSNTAGESSGGAHKGPVKTPANETKPGFEKPERKELRGKKMSLPERQTPSRRGAEPRVKGKLTITNAFDDNQRERSLASLKRKRERLKKQTQGVVVEREKISREVIIPEAITIQELANRMAERGVDIIKFLMKEGQMHQINDLIDTDTAQLIAEEFGHTVKRVSEADVEEGFIGDDDKDEDLEARAPVVTIMGHVDHGKTSLLDAIREKNVVSGEAGGITQHIGAYQVSSASGGKITFIDTPGHEAFTAMRARGAKVTDIVILVVAADDGVMPQTVEAINHAKEGKVPMIVAINKIDKPSADPNRVRTDLLQHEIVVESMSGDILEIEVSALKNINLDKLIEAIQLQSELLELKANPNRSAEGVVIEAKLDKGRGPVGTVLIQRGTLNVGDIVVAGRAWGKVRALIDDLGQQVAKAGPSQPVEILGFDSAPEAGDQLAVVENEARAREITDYRVRKRRETHAAGVGSGLSLEQMMTQLKEQGRQEFPLLVKGDVQGSIEAISAALEKMGNDEVSARIVHAAVGGITESDITLATASGAPVLGFNVRANTQARDAAERQGIEIRYYSVIYDLVDDIKAAMSGLLSPELRETFLGNAEILEIFNISKIGKVAGCRITEGKVERGAKVRLIRDSVVIHEGELSTLKRFKDEVKEVKGGQECGMAFETYQDMRAGDVIECFSVEEIKRTL
ncbi:MAG: translation initiation factor IF-2 [Pseudomonadota bacterium]